MDRIKQRIQREHDEHFGRFVFEIMLFFFVIWGTAAYAGDQYFEVHEDHRWMIAASIVAVCLCAWIACVFTCIFCLGFCLFTTTPRHPNNENNENGVGIQLINLGPQEDAAENR